MKLTKHDSYVQQLVETIRHDYDDVALHVPIRNRKRMLGEVDVLARDGGVFDVFEVKCSRRLVKAKKQARKIRKHLPLEYRRFYFYNGSAGLVEELGLDEGPFG